MSSPINCNHANEVPSICMCPKDCYCYIEGTCEPRTFTNNRCEHLEHAMVMGPGPHICETCQIEELKGQLKAAKEIWRIAQRGCAKHARRGDKLEDILINFANSILYKLDLQIDKDQEKAERYASRILNKFKNRRSKE